MELVTILWQYSCSACAHQLLSCGPIGCMYMIPTRSDKITNNFTLQASGLPLPRVGLGPLPVLLSPSLLLTTTRQCSLEETNKDTESKTVFFIDFEPMVCSKRRISNAKTL